jgi:hypothetical protein
MGETAGQDIGQLGSGYEALEGAARNKKGCSRSFLGVKSLSCLVYLHRLRRVELKSNNVQGCIERNRQYHPPFGINPDKVPYSWHCTNKL